MAGPIKPDMELQREVRRLGLREIRSVLLEEGLGDFKKAVILKLASTVLPRINEHMGEDGGAIIISVSKQGADKYNLDGITQESSNDIGRQE